MSLGFETLFNHLIAYSTSYSSSGEKRESLKDCTHNFSACIGGTIVTVPVELLTAAENLLLKLPVNIASTAVKISLYTLSFTARVICLSHLSRNISSVAEKMPGVQAVILTAFKVVGFTLGAFFTASIGLFISSRANYYLHDRLGLLDQNLLHPVLKENDNPTPQIEILKERIEKMDEVFKTQLAIVESYMKENESE